VLVVGEVISLLFIIAFHRNMEILV